MMQASYSSSQGIPAKTRSWCRCHGTYTCLPIVTSRVLVDTHLATYETRLGYPQKIIKVNEPFMQALMEVSTYITVYYRNGIHAAAWTTTNLGHPLFEWSVSLPRMIDMLNAHV
jgi:hypothetical protein